MHFELRAHEARATRSLVIINCVIYVLMTLMPVAARTMLEFRFGLSADGLRAGLWWQLVTHQFLHGNLLHLGANMLGLWFAGRELERCLGTRPFLVLYFLGGIVGGLAQLVFVPSTPLLIGASGCVFAVLIGMTTLIPNLPITALIFFVLPLRMRAKYLGLGIVVVTVVMWVTGVDPHVGHAAHLGGALVGFVFVRTYVRLRPDVAAVAAGLSGGGGGGGIRGGFRWPGSGGGGGSAPAGQNWSGGAAFPRAARDGTAQFEVLRPEPTDGVERILEKVLREGIDSLTRDELRTLEDARGRRGRRWR